MRSQWGKKGLDIGPIRLVLRGKEAARTCFEKKNLVSFVKDLECFVDCNFCL